MRSSLKAIEVIQHFESLHDGDLKLIGLQPKMCPAGIWTVGWGHALRDPKTRKFLKGAADKEQAYSMFPAMTVNQAQTLLTWDLEDKYEPEVERMLAKYKIEKELNADQFGALTSFCYNCGTSYKNSKGQVVDYAIWKNVGTMGDTELRAYWDSSVIKGGGKILPGLVRRRKSEAHLFITGLIKFEW